MIFYVNLILTLREHQEIHVLKDCLQNTQFNIRIVYRGSSTEVLSDTFISLDQV